MNKRKYLWVAVGVVVIFLAVLWLSSSRHKPTMASFRTARGNEFRLLDVKAGRKYTFMHGDQWQWLLAPFLDTNGVRILGAIDLYPPNPVGIGPVEGSSFATEIQIEGPAAEEIKTNGFARMFFGGGKRWVVCDNSGLEFAVSAYNTISCGHGVFNYPRTTVFPRDARRLTMRFEQQTGKDRAWEKHGEFVLDVPPYPKETVWHGEQNSITRLTDGTEVRLGEVVVAGQHFDLAHGDGDFVRVPLQVVQDGQPRTNWLVWDLKLEDDSGNSTRGEVRRSVTNDWLILTTGRSVDPRRLWRLRMEMGLDSGWLATNLHTADIPVATNWCQTNHLPGADVVIHMYSHGTVSLSLPGTNVTQRLTLLGVQEAGGKRIEGGETHRTREDVSFYGTNKFTQPLRIEYALQPVREVEFVIKPKWVKHNAAAP